jgi:hypothetical protein
VAAEAWMKDWLDKLGFVHHPESTLRHICLYLSIDISELEIMKQGNNIHAWYDLIRVRLDHCRNMANNAIDEKLKELEKLYEDAK